MQQLDTQTPRNTGVLPADFRFTLRRFSRIDDVPMKEAKALLHAHAVMMHGRMVAAGGPDFDINDHLNAFWDSFEAYMPPHGCYYLAYDRDGSIVGTGSLKRLSGTTAEMKHLYVKPEARRAGLGEALVKARIKDARDMGIRELVADTFAANHEQPALYDKIGFERVGPSEMSATGQISPELEPFMLFFRMAL